MPRSPRIELAGAIQHVWARGAVKQTIFLDDLDRRRYLKYFAQVARLLSWRCLGYCLMGNHVHLLLETPEPNLGKGMHRLHGAYAQAFNKRHGKTGHVFESRYGTNPIENDTELWVIVGYIAGNPVKAGLCTTPEAWPWGSHAAVMHCVPDPCLDKARLFSYFGSMGGDPRERYIQHVAAQAKALVKGLAL